MGPLSRYTRSSGVLGDTYGRSAGEIGQKMIDPLKGKPYGVSYKKDQHLFGRPKSPGNKLRWS